MSLKKDKRLALERALAWRVSKSPMPEPEGCCGSVEERLGHGSHGTSLRGVCDIAQGAGEAGSA